MSRGIRDAVAVVAMGCTRVGERWESSTDDLLIEAVGECMGDSRNLEFADVEAFWLGTLASGQSGMTLSRPLGIDYRPVTRVENYCATGSEAFRNACYAVASGAYDTVMAVGVESVALAPEPGAAKLTVIPASGTSAASATRTASASVKAASTGADCPSPPCTVMASAAFCTKLAVTAQAAVMFAAVQVPSPLSVGVQVSPLSAAW